MGHITRNTQQAATKEIVRALLAWFTANARDLPWRRTRDPYAIWVSEIMLQQTQVATVIPYWKHWMHELPTIQSVAKARPAKLRKLWEGLGYYTRVRNLQKAARQIVSQHGGEFPQSFDAILALPGVGRYTAGAISSIAFNQPRPILDGNVMRVLSRLFAIRTNPRGRAANARLWRLAGDLVIEASRSSARTPLLAPATATCSALNQSLMELGAVICTPRNPGCEICPVAKACTARKLGIADRLPSAGERAQTRARHIAAFLVKRGGRILARQRPAGVVNAHFWELPQVELRGEHPNLARLARENLGIRPLADTPRCTVVHHITRYRMRIEVFHGILTQPLPGGRWLSSAQLHRAAFTGADRKILKQSGLT